MIHIHRQFHDGYRTQKGRHVSSVKSSAKRSKEKGKIWGKRLDSDFIHNPRSFFLWKCRFRKMKIHLIVIIVHTTFTSAWQLLPLLVRRLIDMLPMTIFNIVRKLLTTYIWKDYFEWLLLGQILRLNHYWMRKCFVCGK